MEVVNETVYLNTTEIWTLKNNTMVAHPFHIHDIQFNVIEKNGMPPLPTERGWKDVVLVMPGDSVKFITKFETFAHPTVPYMYHCHLLHHEDDGMMGSFVVIDSLATGLPAVAALEFQVYPNPVKNTLVIGFQHKTEMAEVTIQNLLGETIYTEKTFAKTINIDVTSLLQGVYFLQVRSNHQVATRKIIKE
jgi:blue copper oxidase